MERRTAVQISVLQLNQSSLCSLHLSRNGRGGGSNGQFVSIKTTADRRRQRSRKIEKYRVKSTSLRNISTNSKKAVFVVLKNRASAPIKKERWVKQAKQGWRPAEISLWKKAWCQTESKALKKIGQQNLSESQAWVC